MKVSVVIPVYNEERALPLVLQELKQQGQELDIVVADNGSTDKTFVAAQAANVKVAFEPRRGYGQACQAGLRAVAKESEVVVFLDGDHSDYPEDLPKLLEPIERGEAELVIGSRTLDQAQRASLTPQQRMGNWLASRLISWRFGRRCTDVGPFRAIKHDALQRLNLRERAFGWNIEMHVKALKAGLRIVEVPVRARPRLGHPKSTGPLETVGACAAILRVIAKNW